MKASSTPPMERPPPPSGITVTVSCRALTAAAARLWSAGQSARSCRNSWRGTNTRRMPNASQPARTGFRTLPASSSPRTSPTVCRPRRCPAAAVANKKLENAPPMVARAPPPSCPSPRRNGESLAPLLPATAAFAERHSALARAPAAH
eukprot:Amastigsp_a678254_5.p4 type:complete len:148 gc:universal Amastigsp_a678254_5:619-176(-)